MPAGVGVLVDIRKCIGCRACQVACKRWHMLEGEQTELNPEWTNPPSISPNTWTRLRFEEPDGNGEFLWRFVKEQCMHCVDAPCVNVCPTKALHFTDNGYVLYDESLCIGCRYCTNACPFQQIKFDYVNLKAIQKCTFCFERIEEGQEPACVETCSPGALQFFKSYDDLVTEIDKIKAESASPVFVYGLKENGGTRWVYVSDVPFDELHFPTYPAENYGESIESLLAQFGVIGVVAGVATAALYAYGKRRSSIEGSREEKGEAKA